MNLALVVLALAGGVDPSPTWMSPTLSVELTGDAAYYSTGLMRQVAKTRGLDLAGYRGGVALMRCGDLGRPVWIRFPDGWDGPFLAVDCSRRDHYQMNLDRGRVVDISRRLWLAHGLPEDLATVTVRFLPPWPGRPRRAR